MGQSFFILGIKSAEDVQENTLHFVARYVHWFTESLFGLLPDQDSHQDVRKDAFQVFNIMPRPRAS
jgi:hypothetical protein